MAMYNYKKGNYRRRYKRNYKRKGILQKRIRVKQPMWQKLAAGAYNALSDKTVQSILFSLASKINSELKYVDNTFSGNQNTTYALSCLTNVAEGDTQSNRTGISQLNHSLHMRLNLTMNTVATSTYFRVILLVWNENVQETAPSSAKILENNSVYFSPYNVENSKQYSIIKDKTYPLATGGPSSISENWNIKLSPLHSKYTSTGSTSQSTGHVYLMLVSDQSTNTPSYQIYTRIRYYDN